MPTGMTIQTEKRQPRLEVLTFVLILFVGLVYVWSKGDLRWFKAVSKGRE